MPDNNAGAPSVELLVNFPIDNFSSSTYFKYLLEFVQFVQGLKKCSSMEKLSEHIPMKMKNRVM